VFWGHVWTLIAWCELRQDFRMFRVDRIETMTEGATFRVEREKSIQRFFEIEAACR
jgi:predicted DNA-binding transcriptional regulator YafY